MVFVFKFMISILNPTTCASVMWHWDTTGIAEAGDGGEAGDVANAEEERRREVEGNGMERGGERVGEGYCIISVEDELGDQPEKVERVIKRALRLLFGRVDEVEGKRELEKEIERLERRLVRKYDRRCL